MHLTQGTFSYLPELSDVQIRAQVRYMMDNGWAVAIEYSDDPHPRNTYWEMWGQPMFELRDPASVDTELQACVREHPDCYIKLNGYDPSPLRQGQALSFLVHRPEQDEPGFRQERIEAGSQSILYSLQPYASALPSGKRYRQGNRSNGSRSKA